MQPYFSPNPPEQMLIFPLSPVSRDFQPMSPCLSLFPSPLATWVLPKALMGLNIPPVSQEELGRRRGTPRHRQRGSRAAGATPLSTESLTLLMSPLAISRCQSSGRYLSCLSFGGSGGSQEAEASCGQLLGFGFDLWMLDIQVTCQTDSPVSPLFPFSVSFSSFIPWRGSGRILGFLHLTSFPNLFWSTRQSGSPLTARRWQLA